MSGGYRGTPESFQRWAAIERRIATLVNGGMRYDEAYMRTSCEVEQAERDREQQRKLDEIRRLGT